MAEYFIYDAILEGYKADEMAKDTGHKSGEEAAKSWFGDIISCEPENGSFQEKPMYSSYVDSIDDEWDLYYDYGADYYFTMNETKESKL